MDHDDETQEIFKWQWDPKGKLALVISHKQKAQSEDSQRSSVLDNEEPNWNNNDILLAARVLEKDDTVAYKNEAEMRRVLRLVYDVLRFKPILSQALEDINFWQHYKELKVRERVVLLLFYDMQARKPIGINKISKDADRQNVLSSAGLMSIEQALLKSKIALSASLARLRINGQALKFDDLLPRHLRTSDHILGSSGWVNTMKIPNQRDFIDEMSKLGLNVCYECRISDLNENLYNFDPLCPKVVNFHEKAREKLAVSHLVQNFYFIFLDRSLCFGAAALYHAIRVEGFCGPVVLTHSVAPRHVAYLSNLLTDVEHAGRLLVFGTGDKRKIYENYLHNLGITLQQCQIFSESYVASPSSAELERATVVLATPSSSYSGVNDVVDLVIAKGGDTDIFESLSSSDTLQEPKEHISDQLSTLKHALQKPNVQLLIYEVHSILPSETNKIVEEVVEYTNKMSSEKYIKLHTSTKRKKRNKNVETEKHEDGENSDSSEHNEIQVPNSDLFEICTIDEIYKDRNVNKLIPDGCFLTVIKRKDMVQLDSVFMIKFAESKGLFGNTDKAKDNQRLSVLKDPPKVRRKSVKKPQLNWERISSHTQATLIKKRKKSEVCPKVSQRVSLDKDITMSQVLETKKLDAKRWWLDSANYLISSHNEEVPRFRMLRTDPLTQKFLFPLSVLKSAVIEQKDRILATIS